MDAKRQLKPSRQLTPLAFHTFLISGQSNSSGRGELDIYTEQSDPNVKMFGNDYNWKIAYEPTDDKLDQVDMVSFDGVLAGHSYALKAGKDIADEQIRVSLIPCAKGGTNMQQWAVPVNRFDRSTLYGSMNHRRRTAAPNGVTCVWYYGHEGNSNDTKRPDYANDWKNLISEYRIDFGGTTKFIFCQLAKNTDSTVSHEHHLTAEIQRKTEAGSGFTEEVLNTFMVVTFDLPLIDDIHLNGVGQRVLGERIALATREHVLGHSVNGTGPRLVSVTHPGGNKNTVLVKTTRVLSDIVGNADNQFRVFDDSTELAIQSVAKDATDFNSVLITLTSTPVGTVNISYGDLVASISGVRLDNVVKDTDGLPLPQFGEQTVM